MSKPEIAGTTRAVPGAFSAPLLEVTALSVMLEINGAERAVLQDVSLTIRAGEAVGLVGESGADFRASCLWSGKVALGSGAGAVVYTGVSGK